MRRKKRLFGPVSGSSSVGAGDTTSCFTGVGSVFGGVVSLAGVFVGSVKTALGFGGALRVSCQAIFNGLGVIKS
jgi:hypothetical protein